MDRKKVVAVVTGAIAIALSVAYLLIVQILDMRSEMVPAPMGLMPPISAIAPYRNVPTGHGFTVPL